MIKLLQNKIQVPNKSKLKLAANLCIIFIPVAGKLIKYWWQLQVIQFIIQVINSLQKNLFTYENKYLHICIRNSTNSYACDKPIEKFYF